MEADRLSAEGLWRETKTSIAALVSELASMNLLVSQPAMVLRMRPSGITAVERQEHGERTLFSASGLPQQAIGQLLASMGPQLPKDCALDLSPELAVTSRMLLPAESPEVLSAIVRNKVESIAPWPLEQSLHGQRITPVADDPSRVAVDVAIVSRALVDGIAGQLAAAGTTVKAASLQLASGERLPLDVGGREEVVDAGRKVVMIGAAFAAAAAAVSAIGMLFVWSAIAGLQGARTETARLSASLGTAESAGLSKVAAANLLHERRRQRPPAIAVIDELSAVLPQTVWLVALSLEDSKLEIRGQGRDIPALIDVLEQSSSFRDVNFASATQFNEALNAETFAIGASLEAAQDKTP